MLRSLRHDVFHTPVGCQRLAVHARSQRIDSEMTLKKAPDRSRLRATIPRRAVEIVEERSAGGTRLTSKYQLDGDRVGMICWNDDGTTPLLSRGYKNGRPVGWQLEHHFDGSVLFAEYYRYGRVDGWTFQWAVDGQLVARCEFRRGTGIDYWCDPTTGALSEVHPYLAGLPHGCETWWNDDQTTVHIERYWCNGKAHGIEREWNDHGRLARGWPRYFIHGERTDKRRYTRAQHFDPTLPSFRSEDQFPNRTLPRGFERLLFHDYDDQS
jgi:hypothetical protein